MIKKFRNSKLFQKFQQLSFIKKNLILILLCFILLTLASVGYAAFNQVLNITGDLTLRAASDIRITNVAFYEASSSGFEYNNNTFTTNTISLSVSLPDTYSSVWYMVEITNNSDKDYQITGIEPSTNDSTYSTCSTENIEVGTLIPAGEKVYAYVYVSSTGAASDTIASALIEFTWAEYGGDVGPEGRYLAVCNNTCVNDHSCSETQLAQGVYCEVALVMSGSTIVVQDGGYVVNMDSSSNYTEIFMNTSLYGYDGNIFNSYDLLPVIDSYSSYFTTGDLEYDSYQFGHVSGVKARLPFSTEIADSQSNVYSWALPLPGSDYLTGTYNLQGSGGEGSTTRVDYVTSGGLESTVSSYTLQLRPVVRVYGLNMFGMSSVNFDILYSNYLGKSFTDF